MIILTIFALLNGPRGDYSASYEGMDQETIQSLAADRGETVSFVNKKTYDDFVASHPSVLFDDLVKEHAILDAKNNTLPTDQRLDAFIKAIGL